MNEESFKILPADVFNEIGKSALNKIFICEDSLDKPFNPLVEYRGIIYEYPWVITPPLRDIIFKVAQLMGDKGFFVSIITNPYQEDPKNDYRWYIPFSEKWRYPDLIWGPLANYVFSPTGKWGIMLDFEVSLIGGDMNFFRLVNNDFPIIESQVYDYLLFWKEEEKQGHPINWIPSLLQHVYGEKKATIILQEVGL